MAGKEYLISKERYSLEINDTAKPLISHKSRRHLVFISVVFYLLLKPGGNSGELYSKYRL
jgi:hypothetical protein